MTLLRRASCLAAAVGVAALLLAGPIRAEERNAPYAAPKITLGKPVAPPADLLAAAERLRAIAEAKDEAALDAFLRPRLTVIEAGITVDSSRRVTKTGPFETTAATFREIIRNFTEGELPRSAAARQGPTDEERVLDYFVDWLSAPDWSRDPLLDGVVCTARSARWSAAEGRRAGAGEGAHFVTEATPVRAAPSTEAPVVGQLKPGFAYLPGLMREFDLGEDWRAMRLPGGGVGAVPASALHSLAPWGICFAKDSRGWYIAAITTALL